MTAAAATARIPRTRAFSPVLTRLALRVLTGIVLLALWEGLVTWLTQWYVARPSGVVQAAPHVLANGAFWHATRATVEAVFEGLGIGIVAGTLVGLTMGRLRDAESLLKFYVSAFFALPTIAVLPLTSGSVTRDARGWRSSSSARSSRSQ